MKIKRENANEILGIVSVIKGEKAMQGREAQRIGSIY